MIKLTQTEIADFNSNYVRPTPADGMVMTTSLVHGGSLAVELDIRFATEAEQAEFLANVPKSYRLKVNAPGWVRTSFYFATNGTTGDVNEAAGKRFRAILKKMDKLGVPVTHQAQRLLNEQPNVAECLAMIDAPIVVTCPGTLV